MLGVTYRIRICTKGLTVMTDSVGADISNSMLHDRNVTDNFPLGPLRAEFV